MKANKVWAVYFSPNGSTELVTTRIAANLAARLDCDYKVHEFTKPVARKKGLLFSKGDIVVLGVPTYAGRVPNVLLEFLSRMNGIGAFGIPVVTFGNRAYDDSLIELRDIMEKAGIRCIAGCAMSAEHAFSEVLGAGRPDEEDLMELWPFISSVVKKIEGSDAFEMIELPGEPAPYRPYYVAKDEAGNELNFIKAKPVTDPSKCRKCRKCVPTCPMDSIDYNNPQEIRGMCIKCSACIKFCKRQAKSFDDPGYVYHKDFLEKTYAERAKNEYFL